MRGLPFPRRHLQFDAERATRRGRSWIILGYFAVFWIAVPSLFFGLGLRLDRLRELPIPNGVMWSVGGWILVGLGSAMMSITVGQLWKWGRGLPISHLPPTRLVRSGLYRRFRHPIYVGYTMTFAGASVLIGSFWSATVSTLLLLAAWIAYAISFEEVILTHRYGDPYLEYRRQTGMLFPFRLPGLLREPKRWLVQRLNAFLAVISDRPVLWRSGPLIVVWFGLLAAGGVLVLTFSTTSLLFQHGLGPVDIGVFVVVGTLVTGIGAWLAWRVPASCSVAGSNSHSLRRIGFVSYGGLLGVLLWCLVFALVIRWNPLVLTDLVLQALSLAYAVGRIGCLTYGCCWGSETRGDLAVVFSNPDSKLLRLGAQPGIRRHPVQLYSVLHGIAMFVLVNAVVMAVPPAGVATAIALIAFGVGRCITESYRERDRPIAGLFTYGHLGAWIALAVGFLLVFLVPAGSINDVPVLWTISGVRDSQAHFPIVLLSSLLAFIVFGVHWKRLGSWGE